MKNVLFQWKIYFIDIKNCQYDNDDVMSKYDNIKTAKTLNWSECHLFLLLLS